MKYVSLAILATAVWACNAPEITNNRRASETAAQPVDQNALTQQAAGTPSASSSTLNTTNLDLAIEAGMKALVNNLDPNNGGKPFFEVYSLSAASVTDLLGASPYPKNRTPSAGQRFVGRFVSNVTGRTMHALVTGSRSLGRSTQQFKVPLGYLNDDLWMMMFRPNNGRWKDLTPQNQMAVGIPGDPLRYQSNVRDRYFLSNQGAGMRGLYASFLLATDKDAVDPRYGRSIRGLMEVSIHNLLTYYVYDEGGQPAFDWERFRRTFGLIGGTSSNPDSDNWAGLYKNAVDPFILYALLDYYAETKSARALKLARELKAYGFAAAFPAGKAMSKSHGHMFEVTAAINSYSRLAQIEGDQEAAERVRTYFDALLARGFVMKSGWVAERAFGSAAGIGTDGTALASDTGEVNCTGELVEAAIRFGDSGRPIYYEFAERAIRGHMLPAQLLDTANLVEADPPKLASLVKGSFGFPAPYGPIPVKNSYFVSGYFQDITAGAVSSLAVARASAHQRRGRDLYVPLLFDLDSNQATVTTPYVQASAPLTIRPKAAFDRIYLRAPTWLDRAKFAASVAEGPHAGKVALTGDWIVLTANGSLEAWALPFVLTPTQTTEPLNGRTLTTDWLGDGVVKMTNFGAPYPFFN